MLLKCFSGAVCEVEVSSVSLPAETHYVESKAWQRPWPGGIGDFTFLPCPMSEGATLYYLSVVKKHIGLIYPAVTASKMSYC